MTEVKLKVKDMCCKHCAHHVEEAIKALPNIKKVKIDVETKDVVVYVIGEADTNAIFEAVKTAGYTPEEGSV